MTRQCGGTPSTSGATEALGLPPDADSRAIRHAYATPLKTTRPDCDPAAFQQLHQTYREALVWMEATTCPHASTAGSGIPPAQRAVIDPLPGEAQARHWPGPLADIVQASALEAELTQWQDDAYLGKRAEHILAAAHTMLAADFGPWLPAIRSAPVTVQMAVRWRALATLSSRSKRIAHRWALPTASIAVLAGKRGGRWGTTSDAALATSRHFA